MPRNSKHIVNKENESPRYSAEDLYDKNSASE